MTSANGDLWVLPCPVCGRGVLRSDPGPCASCGLPAVGQAALVVARIEVTIDEMARDRDRLLDTLRAAAAGAPPAPPEAPARPAHRGSPIAERVPPGRPGSGPFPAAPLPAPSTEDRPRLLPAPARRISPQQVLLGLGALLVVAAAIAFVAVAWTRLGLVFQAAVMGTVTVSACGISAWTARRGLRATEEALAAAGAALLAVDLGAAHALGLWGLDGVVLRLWTAASCGTVVAVALALGRLTRSTTTWPLVALLAAQPVPVLLVPESATTAAVAALLGTALLDVGTLLRLRPVLAPIAQVLATLATVAAALGGTAVAWSGTALDGWIATALLAAAGPVGLLLRQEPRLAARLPRAVLVAGVGAGVAAVALAGSLARSAAPGWMVAAGLGVALLTASVPVVRRPVPLAALLAGGGVLVVLGGALLALDPRLGLLGLVVAAGTVPAALAAVRVPEVRRTALITALLCPPGAVLLVREDGWLTSAVAGLLVVLVAVTGFALASARVRTPEEPVAAGAATLVALVAALATAEVGAWGQTALHLGLGGAAAGVYALVSRRRDVAVLAVADLVVAAWVAAAGARVETPEAYTLPAALGLLLVTLPQLRARGWSWTAEGPALATALVPSALVVVAEPSVLRLVLVVVAAAALTVGGTLAHRQAPFVLGSAALAFVVLSRLAPYAPLVPRWLTLATVGLTLLMLGATYERRRQQAREAVAWVAQMR
ncbi:SCO7613 C-terminal domain-containing membrane protein [Geodermatophilus sp. SYSU D00703]